MTRPPLNLLDRNPWLALLGGCLAVWAAMFGGVCYGQDSLDGGAWNGKIAATPDAPAGSITDLPYVVQIDSSRTQFWAAVQNDGDDVRAKIDGAQVPCWVDPATFNYAGQSCLIYVMRSSTFSSAPVIEIYFGNSGATLPANNATYGQFNSFPSSWKGFYPRGGGDDVTQFTNHLTMSGSPTIGGLAGPINGSLRTQYDGTDDQGIKTSATSIGANSTIFASCLTGVSDTLHVFRISNAADTSRHDLYRSTTTVNCFVAPGNVTTTKGTISAIVWYSGAATNSPTSRAAYMNGVSGTANTTTPTSPSGMNQYRIAQFNSNVRWNGGLAFVGVCDITLSADYLAYWHAMLADPDQSDFYNGWTYSAVSSPVPSILLQLSDMRLPRQQRHFETYGVYALSP